MDERYKFATDMYFPVYRTANPPPDPVLRDKEFVGFVSTAFVLMSVLRLQVEPVLGSSLDFCVFDDHPHFNSRYFPLSLSLSAFHDLLGPRCICHIVRNTPKDQDD